MENTNSTWEYTTRTASLQMNGDKRAVLVEVGISDDLRLQVLLSKALDAMALVEREIESMSEDEVSSYLESRAKHHFAVTHGCDGYPRQGSFLGRTVEVCFNYDTSCPIRGTVIRDDTEEPGLLLIRLENGQVVRSTECQYRPI